MRHDSEKGPDAAVATTRAEVVEILAGAVLELLLQPESCPSPDEAPGPQKAADSTTSGQIRGSQ